MAYKQRLIFLLLPVLLFAAADQSWQTKPIAEWNEDEAHQVLTDSPWAKTVTPTVSRAADSGQSRRRSGMGQMGGMGGVGIGMPGMGGMGRRGGMGAPSTGSNSAGNTDSGSGAPPTLTVRWESALPVQGAELKTRSINAPAMDEDYYAIEVSGIPSKMIHSDGSNLEDQLKGQAVIKRDGKKDLKPSSVKVLTGDDSTAVVYFFSHQNEITRKDKLEFNAQILQLKFTRAFNVEEMMYQGKLEL